MTSKMLWTHLNEMNWYIKYMPGDKKALDNDELVDIFIYSHKKWYRDLMTKSDFKYWLKSSRDIINYISRLSLIEGMVQQGHQNGMMAAKMPHKGQMIQSKHKKQCNYYHKYGHVEAKCRKKKCAEKEKAQTKTEENHAMEAEAYDSNEDLVQFLNDNFPEEVREDEFIALNPLLTTHNPLLNDTTSPIDLVTEVCVVIKTDSDEENIKLYKVLIDTCCSHTIVHKDALSISFF